MTKHGSNFVIFITLLFFPFAALPQETSAPEDALNPVKSEIKQLIEQEKEQESADINSLRNEIDNLLRITEQLRAEISALKKGHGVSYSSAKSSSAAVAHYEQLSEELETLVKQMKSTMSAAAQTEQGSPKLQKSPVLEKLTVTGQVRFRQDVDRKNFAPGTDVNEKGLLRSRLGMKFQPAQNVTTVLQFQDSRTFGVEGGNTLANGSNIDLHQGYILLENIFKLPGLSLKVGRQEIAFGGQRLIGTVGWHNVGRSFDGGRLAFSRNGVSGEVWTAKLAELFAAGDSKDNVLVGFDVSAKKNSAFMPRAYLILERNSNKNENGVNLLARNTFGVHASGKIRSVDYEFETTLQTGWQEASEIAAFLVGFAAGYTFPVKSKARVAIGYDHLSGNDGTAGTIKVFNTLYATNHKFYGYMDYFLNIPVHTRGFGLRDFMIKSSVNLSPKFVGKADLHFFNYAEKDEAGQTSLGKEVDLTLVYKFLKPVKIVSGASLFFAGDVFKRLHGDRLGVTLYSMMILNF